MNPSACPARGGTLAARPRRAGTGLAPEGRALALATTALALAVAVVLAAPAQAQALPDAGRLRQQIEQPREPSLPPAVPAERAAPATEAAPLRGATVRPQAFRLEGNSLLSAEQLAPALAPFVGTALDFAGLQRAAEAVAARYREAGRLARVFLPEQDLASGVVTLRVLEARYAGLQFEGEPPHWVAREEIERWFQAAQPEGAFLDAAALDRALLLVDDLPGLSVAGSLVAGPGSGQTALVLQAADEPRVSGDLGLDNFGARFTGSQRLTANLNLHSPGQRGELLALSLIHTQGSDYARLGFTVPSGYQGLRLGVNASSLSYRLVDGPASITALQLRGSSSSLGLEGSYPLQRTRLHNLYVSGGLDTKTFASQNIQSTPGDPKSFSDYETQSLRLALAGNRFDTWGGGGASSASAQWLWGRLGAVRGHSQFGALDTAYQKLSYSASRQQTLGGPHSLYLSLAGQHATQPLDSSEKFYIGGAQSVRAYPSSELGGERGQLLSAEWRWRLDSAWVFTPFVDLGRVVALPVAGSGPPQAWSLRGQGLSLGWQGPRGMSARLVWAQRLGHHPKPTAAGTDGDGTLRQNRLWWSASLPF